MKTDGGPAFPIGEPETLIDGTVQNGFYGMSLRDWFAAQALPAIIQVCAGDTRGDGETIAQLFARKSYGIADAMLEARALK